jgi:hypothetical protein
MKLTEEKVLTILAKKGSTVITYDDFHRLRPSGEAGGHWLHTLKKILAKNGCVVHEARRKALWGNCRYRGAKTHFHSA